MKTLFKSTRLNELVSRSSQFSFKAAFALVWSFLLSVVFMGSVNAQQSGSLPEVTIIGTTTDVNEKVLNVFERSFREAENPRWFKLGRKYMVKYNVEDMLHKALFRNKGGFIYDMGYGTEKHLPGNLQTQVKGNYKDFAITTAVNVRQSDRNLWKINIEDDQNIVLLHAEDGLLIEEDRIEKASGATAEYTMTQSLNRLLSDMR
ncbi:MAG TPA: hypothetical protein VGE26_02035 [Sphingobacteriaceae bacterium]